MNKISQPIDYESDRVWKTIDDVNATLDALSLINRGQPTSSGLNAVLNTITNTNLNDTSAIIEARSHNGQGNNKEEESISSGCYMLGRGKFIKELTKQRAPCDKDMALQAELDMMFPHGFSNEVIEKRWCPRDKVDEDQFEDADLKELIEIESKIGFAPQSLFLQEEIDIRSCSPPLSLEADVTKSTSNSSSPLAHQQLGIVTIPLDCGTSLNELEFSTGSDSEQRRSSSLAGSDVGEEKLPIQSPLPLLRPTTKKCRNALLNSIYRMERLDKERKEISQSIVLKTPSDFLNFSTCNNVHSVSTSDHNNSFSYSSRLEDEQRVKSNRRVDSDSFVYDEDDFPAL
ncbi:uncharacterized protein isoform X1 [Rhodnius prolixus]|uniref:uncharacterized protein isoform X1 n=1 Tax=Rhodnius prolixus TaxID=13249 RepID=UPI003D18AF48